jgi:hypothetical protein
MFMHDFSLNLLALKPTISLMILLNKKSLNGYHSMFLIYAFKTYFDFTKIWANNVADGWTHWHVCPIETVESSKRTVGTN